MANFGQSHGRALRLFIIIALGDGLIVTGAIYAGAQPSPGLDSAFLNAFLASFVMWWIYFDVGAARGAWHIEHHDAPGLIARQAFTYRHIPIVAGIIVYAVVDALVLADPFKLTDGTFVLVVGSAMTLFLWGNMAFKRISSGNPWYPLSHWVGLGLTVGIGVWGLLDTPPRLPLAVASTAVLAIVAL